MASTFTTNKLIEKPAHNASIDTWDVPVNADWDVIDACLGGTTSLNVTAVSGTVTLTSTQYRPPILLITGLLTANVTYAIPSGKGGVWTVYNGTTGSFTLTIASGGGGLSVAITQGYTIMVFSDGTNIGTSVTAVPAGGIKINNSNWLGAQLTVANGGTGLTSLTSGGALYASGTTTVASGTLPVTAGGTGVTTATGSGNVVLSASPTLTGTVSAAAGAFSGNVTIGGTLGMTGDVTLAATAPTSTLSAGYRGAPPNPQPNDYTFVAADDGKRVFHNNASGHTYTIPPNSSVAFGLDTIIVLSTILGAVTIAQGAGVTLTWAGSSSTGNRTLSPYGLATIVKVATDTWMISGAGVT